MSQSYPLESCTHFNHLFEASSAYRKFNFTSENHNHPIQTYQKLSTLRFACPIPIPTVYQVTYYILSLAMTQLVTSKMKLTMCQTWDTTAHNGENVICSTIQEGITTCSVCSPKFLRFDLNSAKFLLNNIFSCT